MENPRKPHWNAAKHVLRYLQSTKSMGLTFKNEEPLELITFCDADYAGDPDTRKSTSGYLIICAGAAIAWRSKKQSLTAQSTVEAETIALSFAIREMLWIQKLLQALNIPQKFARLINVDNQGCISICKNGSINDQTKHIGVKLGLIKDHIDQDHIALQYTPTNSMAADILTKQLNPTKQTSILSQIGLTQTW